MCENPSSSSSSLSRERETGFSRAFCRRRPRPGPQRQDRCALKFKDSSRVTTKKSENTVFRFGKRKDRSNRTFEERSSTQVLKSPLTSLKKPHSVGKYKSLYNPKTSILSLGRRPLWPRATWPQPHKAMSLEGPLKAVETSVGLRKRVDCTRRDSRHYCSRVEARKKAKRAISLSLSLSLRRGRAQTPR